MSQGLPETLDVDRLIAARARFAGQLPLRRFRRLHALLLDDTGDVDYELGFGRDQEGRSVVTGRVTAEVVVQCERCLAAVSITLDCPVALQCVHSEAQALQVSASYEPLLLDGSALRSVALIEDELILSLPIVPRHDEHDQACRPASVGRTGAGAERVNPFSDLARLKRSRPEDD